MEWNEHLKKFSGLFFDTWVLSVLLINLVTWTVYASRWNVLFGAFAFLCIITIGSRINDLMYGKHGLKVVHAYVWSFLTLSSAFGLLMYRATIDYPLVMAFVWSIFSAGFTVWVFSCVSHNRVPIKKTPR